MSTDGESRRARDGHPPAWIETLEDADARAAGGELAEVYARRSDAHQVAHILRSSTLNPPALKAFDELYRATMFAPSPLSRAQREMLATLVSQLNHCVY